MRNNTIVPQGKAQAKIVYRKPQPSMITLIKQEIAIYGEPSETSFVWLLDNNDTSVEAFILCLGYCWNGAEYAEEIRETVLCDDDVSSWLDCWNGDIDDLEASMVLYRALRPKVVH